MEATQDHATPPVPLAELVLQNGRLAGTRRPLLTSLTCIGRAPECDIRLNVDGIQPLHCILAHDTEGWLVRDLDSESRTQVNGAPVSACRLQDGDLLTVGAFQFRLEATAACDAGRDALRVQAAAVAAQQAALYDQEARLQQQQDTLTQQQEQLAAHLEDKRQRLQHLAEQVQIGRASLKREQEEQQDFFLKHQEELARNQAELEKERMKVQADRKRVAGLGQRLKERFERRWVKERQEVRARYQEVAAGRQRLELELHDLRLEREALAAARLSFNGERELGKRQLQDREQDFARAQKKWQEERAQQDADLASRVRAVRQGEEALLDAERALGDAKHRWAQKKRVVEQEVYGLESRLNNQRRKLLELQCEIARAEQRLGEMQREETPIVAVLVDQAEPPPLPDAPTFALIAAAAPDPFAGQVQERAAQLERFADDLADQRLLLLEHWQRLVATHHAWDAAHQEAIAHLEALVASLPHQEQALLERQHSLEAAEDNLRQRQQELSQLRQRVEGWAARICVQETTWEAERDRLLLDLRQREELADSRLTALEDVRQRWARRRKRELDLLRKERLACDKVRLEYATLRQECWRRSLTLDEQHREVSESRLALEEYRHRFVLQTQDSAAVESKLEKLRHHWTQRNAQLVELAAGEVDRLDVEAAHLHQRGRELLKASEELAEREATLSQRQTNWEEQLTVAEAQQQKLQHRLQSLLAQRQRSEQQIAELKAEVERLARVLLDEIDEPPLALAQAA